MMKMSRRGLIKGGATAIVGAAALPLWEIIPVNAADLYMEYTLEGLPDGGRLVVWNYGNNRVMATFVSRDGHIQQQDRLDWTGRSGEGERWWTREPRHGRVLQNQPINPQVGIFGQTGNNEQYRINVNGFGVVVFRGPGQLTRLQVVGYGGRHHYAEIPVNSASSAARSLVNTFIDQTHTLNNQFAAYRTAVAQYAAGAAAALATGLALLIVNGGNPVAAIGFVAAVTGAGVAAIGNIRNAQNTYMTTYNNMINTFNRLSHEIGIGALDIPLYNVGAVTWNRAAQQARANPSYVLFPAHGSNG